MGKKYTEYSKLNLTQLADEVRGDWEKNDIFAKSLDIRKHNKPFVFYEGPPYAN